MSLESQIETIEKNIFNAKSAYRKQKSSTLRGKKVRVRPEFWMQVIRDYRMQLNALKK